MNLSDYITEILPKTLNYRLAYFGLINPANPMTLTFSVTCACNSRCKTCAIGHEFAKNPLKAKEDLSLGEIEKVFKSLGHVYFFNISGGEPFMRNDLPQIVELACKYLSPKIIHTPTNAILSQRIYDNSKKILEIINRYNPKIQFSVKPSIDGIGDRHDEIRGVSGNFQKLEKTIALLKKLETQHPNFHFELGTVVSKFNQDALDEVEDYVHAIGVQSYRNEIAEQRQEFFNMGNPIAPSAEEYEEIMKKFKQKIRNNIKSKKKLAKMTEALRLTYYDIAAKIMKEKRQVIPCYAGISNVHINSNGDIWPCCVLGYSKPLGNLRKSNYNFQDIWYSPQAREVRKHIGDKKCFCPLANQAYSNILCDPVSILKTIKNLLSFKSNKTKNNTDH